MIIGHLSPTPPYNFAHSIAAVNYHAVLDVVRDGAYWRALRLDGGHVLVRVRDDGAPEHPRLAVEIMAAEGSPDPQTVLDEVARMLGVHADIRPFYAAAQADPLLWRIVAPLYGLRHIRAASLFEALMTTIIEQQISLRQAQKGERWLMQWAGESIEYHGEHFYTFPRPQHIATATVDDLKPLKITNRRMQVMIDIAQAVSSGALDLEALLNHPPDEAQTALVGLKGIGQWTAGWAVIRATGHYPYIGENDVALQAAINHYFYQQTGRTTPQVVKETLARYGDFAGAVAFFTLMRWATDRY